MDTIAPDLYGTGGTNTNVVGMKELLQFPAELISHKTYATKHNVSVIFELQENLVPEQLAQLLGAKGKTGFLVFNPTSGERIEIDDIPTQHIEKDTKTPSQRLRNALYVVHKSNAMQEPFEVFYQQRMEKYIEHAKAQIKEGYEGR